MNHKIILPIALFSSFFLHEVSNAASCTFDTTKTCKLATDILNDKAANGLNYYSATNYDHRMSGEINVYDVSKVQKAANGAITLLAKLVSPGFWQAGEIMTRDNLSSPPYNSPTPSEVWTTKGSAHGYVEVTAKLPVCTTSTDGKCQLGTNPTSYNQGLWPAIWMMPTYDGNWPQNGEIDIMEAYPKNTAFNITTATLHFNGNNSQCTGGDCRGAGFSLEHHQFPTLAYNTPHTWGFEWQKDPQSTTGYVMTGYIDNVKVWGPIKSSSLPADGANALQRGFNDPNGGYYLIVNLAIGGPYAGTPNPQMQTASMQVSSVKVYDVSNVAPTLCTAPMQVTAAYTADKKNVIFNWTAPTDGSAVQSYIVKDWQKRVLWQGNQTTWTDKTLPGSAGKFTYFLTTQCTANTSNDSQFDVVIPSMAQCNPPSSIASNYSADKKNITLNWNAPTTSLQITGYQVRDWQQRLLWQGAPLTWTDKSLPGKNGTFIYYINTVCNTLNSTKVQKNVVIN